MIILILMASGEKKWYDLLRMYTLAMDNWIIQDFSGPNVARKGIKAMRGQISSNSFFLEREN